MKRQIWVTVAVALVTFVVGMAVGSLFAVRGWSPAARESEALLWAVDEGFLAYRDGEATMNELATALYRYHRRFVEPLHEAQVDLMERGRHICGMEPLFDQRPFDTETVGYGQDDHWHEILGVGAEVAGRVGVTCDHRITQPG